MNGSPREDEVLDVTCPECGSALVAAPPEGGGHGAGSPRGFCPRCDHMYPLAAD